MVIMKSLAQEFLSPEEQKQITDAVHAAERCTSGEIVPLITSGSHSYPMAAMRGGMVFALPLAILLTAPVAGMFWLTPTNMWVFLLLFFPLFFGISLVIQAIPGLKRFFLFKGEMLAEVEEAAHVSFFIERLYQTRDANGVLLYISLLERQAWVIADSGINDRIPVREWEEVVALVTQGIKEKKQAQAICQAVSRIGEILEKDFPVQADDENELHDLIIR